MDGVTNEQSDDLRKKSKRGQTEPEQWYAIWAILFSSSKQPDSPYMDFEQSQEFAEWEEFCQRRASIVLVEQLSRQIWGGSGSPAWLPDLLRIVQDGFRAAFDEFRSQDGSSVLSSEVYDDVDGTRLGGLGAVCPGRVEDKVAKSPPKLTSHCLSKRPITRWVWLTGSANNQMKLGRIGEKYRTLDSGLIGMPTWIDIYQTPTNLSAKHRDGLATYLVAVILFWPTANDSNYLNSKTFLFLFSYSCII